MTGKKDSLQSLISSNTWDDKYLSTLFVFPEISQSDNIKRILLRKYLIIGHAVAAWFKRPTVDSSNAYDTFFRTRIFPKSESHRLNFFLGKAMLRFLVFISHPRRVKHSANCPSSANFPSDRQSSLFIGSFISRGRHKVCIASNNACTARCLLSLISGTITIPSSIKISAFPKSSGSNTTSRGLADLKCKDGSNSFGSGKVDA